MFEDPDLFLVIIFTYCLSIAGFIITRQRRRVGVLQKTSTHLNIFVILRILIKDPCMSPISFVVLSLQVEEKEVGDSHWFHNIVDNKHNSFFWSGFSRGEHNLVKFENLPGWNSNCIWFQTNHVRDRAPIMPNWSRF